MAQDPDTYEQPIDPIAHESVSTIDDPIEPLTATFMPDDVFDAMMVDANSDDTAQAIIALGEEMIGLMYSGAIYNPLDQIVPSSPINIPVMAQASSPIPPGSPHTPINIPHSFSELGSPTSSESSDHLVSTTFQGAYIPQNISMRRG